MSRKVSRIKGIEDNSQIKAIGNFVRLIDGSEWRINLELEPGQAKRTLGVSQLPLIARRRLLNPDEEPKPAGYRMKFAINTADWSVANIQDCPIAGVAQKKDREQWCFRFLHAGVDVFLPQLEFARALFLYEPYLCRLAMNPGGIAEEFDVQKLPDPDNIQINLLPSCRLPKHVRGDYELRRSLASVILNPDVRASFESISSYQIRDAEVRGRYRVWRFRFDPPPLERVSLTVRGQYDQAKSVFFVYEVYGLEGLACNHPHNVHFYDPDYNPPQVGASKSIPVTPQSYPEFEIDDYALPVLAKGNERVVESPQIIRSFKDPAHTTRSGRVNKRRFAGVSEAEMDNDIEGNRLQVSTDEASRMGSMPGAGIDGLEDCSDDTHNFAGRFQSFAAMVELLHTHGCQTIHAEIRKLPPIRGRTKHLLDDGSPRLWSIYLLQFNAARFALMEVDTLGNRSQLSTLLIKQPSADFSWQQVIREIELLLVKDSLKWPSTYLDTTFPADSVQRIAHPQTASTDKSFLEADSIQHWADRVLFKMQ